VWGIRSTGQLIHQSDCPQSRYRRASFLALPLHCNTNLTCSPVPAPAPSCLRFRYSTASFFANGCFSFHEADGDGMVGWQGDGIGLQGGRNDLAGGDGIG
jgi:hypothetical protein